MQMQMTEIEFSAEEETASIVPNFPLEKLRLIKGDFGPFVPGFPVTVPLWLAIYLTQRKKCTVVIPGWLDNAELEKKKREEAESKVLTAMPSAHFMEIATLVLQQEQITQIEAKRTLLKDIFDIRMSKLRSSIDLFVKSDAKVAKLTHLTRFELNTVREFLSGAVDTLSSLAQLEDEADERVAMSLTSGANATQSHSTSFFERHRDSSIDNSSALPQDHNTTF